MKNKWNSKLRGLAFFALTCGIALPGVAESSAWISIGMGNNSCGSYSQAFSDGSPDKGVTYLGGTYFSSAATYTQWVVGYLTGLNLASRSKDHQIQLDLDGIGLSIKKICDAHPDWSVLQATAIFSKSH